jgi:hypothetical protein
VFPQDLSVAHPACGVGGILTLGPFTMVRVPTASVLMQVAPLTIICPYSGVVSPGGRRFVVGDLLLDFGGLLQEVPHLEAVFLGGVF